MSELLFEQLSNFGDYAPSIPFAEGIDKDALIAGDEDPMFVTLPIGKVGAKSRNGRVYPEAAIKSLVEQINKNRNGGNKGHLRTEDRATRFDLPVLEWVGAVLDPNGKAYGKAYVPKYAPDVREYLKNAKALRKSVATSIYGSAVMSGNTVSELQLESIDLADPHRAGVPDAVSLPVLTTEMETNTMSENQNELISELRNDRDELRQKLEGIQEQVTTLNAELKPLQVMRDALQEMAGDKEVVKFVAELIEERNRVHADKLKLEINEAIQEQVKLEAARPLFGMMLGQVDSKEAAVKRIQELMDEPSMKTTLQSLALAASGGRVFVGEHKGTVDEDLNNPDRRAKAYQNYSL